ncbi:MAG: hypothetical protein QOH63_1990 [Acidobacteriota bacterium]|jgi:hypothetical protein|nr:hypothetical protein [Acidobacteriota bacterium]
MANLDVLLKFLGDNTDARIKSTELRAAMGADLDKILLDSKATAAALKAEHAKMFESLKGTSTTYKAELKSATDVLIAESQKSIASAEKTALGATQALQTTTNAVRAAEQETGGLKGALSSLAGPAGLAALAIGAIGIGLFELVKHTAEAENRLYALSQKTQLSVETLSALDIAAEKNGSSVDKLAQGLVILDKNLSKANTGTDVASKLLRSWNIDLSNNEKALVQIAQRLSDYSKGGNKAADAQALMGRSGAEFLKVTNQLWKEAGGNLDVYKEKLREAGILMTDKAAESGHKFEEQLVDLQNTFSALARDIAQQEMPKILAAMNELRDWAKDNKEGIVSTIDAIASAVGLLAKAAIGVGMSWLFASESLSGYLQRNAIATKNASPTWLSETFSQYMSRGSRAEVAMAGMRDAGLQMIGGTVPHDPEMDRLMKRGPGEDAPALPKGGKGGGGADKARQDQIRVFEEQSKQIQRDYKNETDDINREYELQRITIETKTEEIVAAIKDYYDKRRAVILQKQALAKKGSEREKFGDELTNLDDESQGAIQKAFDDAAKTLRDSRRKLQEDILKLQEDFDTRNINAIQGRIKIEQETEVAGERQIAEIERKAYQRRWADLVAQREDIINHAANVQEGANSKEVILLNAQIKRLEEIEKTAGEERERRIAEAEAREILRQQEYVNTILALGKRYIENQRAQERQLYEWALNNPYSSLNQRKMAIAKITEFDLIELEEQHRHNQAVLDAEQAKAIAQAKRLKASEEEQLEIIRHYKALKAQEETGYTDQRKERQDKGNDDVTFAGANGNPFGALVGQFTDNANIIAGAGQIISSTFNAIGQAAGNAVKAFILFGSTGGSFRKWAAEMIASVAQMAVVQAIFEAAQAAAMYGLFYFTGNASFLKSAIAHGQAALMFGLVAAAAVPIGRLAAGDAFKQDQQQQGAVNGVVGGGGGTQYKPFTYDSQTPSASQAASSGSRTGTVLSDVLKEVVASNNRVADGHAQVAAAINYNTKVMAGIESYPPGDLIRQNAPAVGDAMQENYRTYHEVTKDTISLGSTGRT